MLRALDRLWAVVDETLPGLLIGLVAVMITVDIVLRNYFRSTIPDGVEIATYAFVWMIFLGAAGASRTGTHFQVDFIERIGFRSARLAARVTVEIFNCAVAAIMAFYSWQYTSRSWNRVSEGLEMPLGYFYIIFPICFALMALAHIRRGTGYLLGRREP